MEEYLLISQESRQSNFTTDSRNSALLSEASINKLNHSVHRHIILVLKKNLI